MRYTSEPDKLIYDERPVIANRNDNVVADTRPQEGGLGASTFCYLKNGSCLLQMILLKTLQNIIEEPGGNPGSDFPFVQNNFNDDAWETVNLPHDWAINGPFHEETNAIVGGGMGRLPVQGVAWYRKKLKNPSYGYRKSHLPRHRWGHVICNGLDEWTYLVGGWPYGYNLFRLDLTPYFKPR